MNDIIIRDNTIDILKGIGIVLVVMGHSGVPQWMYNFIYSFHMPLFFIASGWFLTTRLTTTVDFVKRKIKGIYCPFVKWSIIFLLLHNVFYHIGIINGFYGHNGIVAELYTKRDFLSNLLNIVFRMSGYDSFLLGAFWFMRALFIANIILFLGCTIMKKNGPESAKNMLQLTVLSAVWGGHFHGFRYNFR